MSLRRRFEHLTEELSRDDNSLGDKVLRIAQRGTVALGLSPRVSINRLMIVETSSPPKPFRGMRDVIVRRATERDVGVLCTIDDGDPARIRGWLARGDLAYVAELDGEVVCHTWFHPGPTPFEGDRAVCADWALDAGTFWSFKGASRADVRESGLFVKLFQEALREVFEVHGARRVQGFIAHTNHPSLIMHERLGFTIPGSFLAIGVGGLKWIRWDGGGRTRQWLLPRASSTAIPLPPP
ncbi:MAG TPA: hypothetical protein VKZ18_09435 [Polyangia bacterium]|nr:hypothetical protein [Polyangia bacterium]